MAAKKKSASRRSTAKKAKSNKGGQRPAARKSAALKSKTTRNKTTRKKAVVRRKKPAPAAKAAPRKPPPAKAPSSPALAEIDQRIAIVRRNLRELMDQASASSGSAVEELLSDRIAGQEAELLRLRQERDAIAGSSQAPVTK